MKLFLALSCLQQRPQREAIEELCQLPIDGIQLTPGCVPSLNCNLDFLKSQKIQIHTHNGYTPYRYRAEVWDTKFKGLFVNSQSVHPPKQEDWSGWMDWFEEFRMRRSVYDELIPIIETMYPGYHLGCDADLEFAMDNDWALAVDVSHIDICLNKGTVSQKVWTRLQDYHNVQEIHVSQSSSGRDVHMPVTRETFGIEWACKREHKDNIPVILECYMHKLSTEERIQQIELLRSLA